jgi:hypothetical protein
LNDPSRNEIVIKYECEISKDPHPKYYTTDTFKILYNEYLNTVKESDFYTQLKKFIIKEFKLGKKGKPLPNSPVSLDNNSLLKYTTELYSGKN